MSHQLEKVRYNEFEQVEPRPSYVCRPCSERRRVVDITTRIVGLVSLVGMILSVAGGPFEVFLAAAFIALFFRLLFVRSPLRALACLRDGPRRLPSRQHRELER